MPRIKLTSAILLGLFLLSCCHSPEYNAYEGYFPDGLTPSEEERWRNRVDEMSEEFLDFISDDLWDLYSDIRKEEEHDLDYADLSERVASLRSEWSSLSSLSDSKLPPFPRYKGYSASGVLPFPEHQLIINWEMDLRVWWGYWTGDEATSCLSHCLYAILSIVPADEPDMVIWRGGEWCPPFDSILRGGLTIEDLVYVIRTWGTPE